MSLFRNLLIEKKRRRYYCEVEYLESTGTQYIDTGVREDTTCIINMQATQTTNTTQVVLANTLEGSRTKWFGTAGNTNYYSVGGSSGVSSVSATTRKECVVTFTNMYSTTSSSVSFYFKDDPANVYTRSDTVSGGITLTNICVGSSVTLYPSYVKLFGLKIYNTSNILIRDFIPVLDWNMTPCMYDKVTGQLFYNQGTGSFTYGREIHYVEYLENTSGNYANTGGGSPSNYGSYINTGIHPKPSGKVKIGIKFNDWENNTPYQCIFGGYDSNTKNFGVVVNMKSGTDTTYFMDGTQTSLDVFDYEPDTYYDFEYSASGKSLSINGNNYLFLSANPLSTQSNLSIYLFTDNSVGSSMEGYNTTYTLKGKIYYFQYYEDNELMGDFYPAIDENGVGFMFDRVSHTCFLNAGIGAFKYPARQLDYLEATGTQYINTGYKPNTNTECSIDFMFNAIDSTYRTPFSIRTSDGAADSFTISGASTVQNAYAFGYNQWWDGNGGCPMPVIGTKYNGTLKSGRATFGNVVGNAGTTITPSSLTAYMFARNANGTAANFFKGRIYDCQLKENGTLVRDYIPCYKDGSAGMLDKANNVFYTNAGSGSFGYGRIRESEYE